MAYNIARIILMLHAVVNFGNTTRFLPFIIWDHVNPLLTCKCNWLTIPKVDQYDQVDLTCPSLKVTSTLLDSYTPSTSYMNENIFRRKWNGSNLDDLKNALDDGSFCNPNHNATERLYSCKNGEEGKSLVVKFKPNRGSGNYKKGDIVVFFNNGNDGKIETLDSKAKKCAMVFIVNITANVGAFHDITYAKCLNQKAENCRDINVKCKSRCDSCSSRGESSTKIPNTSGSSTSISTKKQSTQSTNEKTPPPSPSPSPSPSPGLTSKYKHKDDSRDEIDTKSFVYGFFTCFGSLLFVGFIAIVVFIMRRKKENERKQGFGPESASMVRGEGSGHKTG